MTKEEILAEYEKEKLLIAEEFRKTTTPMEKGWKDDVEAAWKLYYDQYLGPLFKIYKGSCAPAQHQYDQDMLRIARKRDEALEKL